MALKLVTPSAPSAPLSHSWLSPLPCSYIYARPAFCLQSVPTEPCTFETSSEASLKPVRSLILRMRLYRPVICPPALHSSSLKFAPWAPLTCSHQVPWTLNHINLKAICFVRPHPLPSAQLAGGGRQWRDMLPYFGLYFPLVWSAFLGSLPKQSPPWSS